MSKLTIETLGELKEYFDSQLDATLSQIGENDSERLVKNRVNGFLLVILDKLIQIKPKLACSGCGALKAEDDSRAGSVSQANRTFTQKMPIQRHGEQTMSNNSHTLHEQLAKSRLTIIAENSPDMTNSKMKTTKYA